LFSRQRELLVIKGRHRKTYIVTSNITGEKEMKIPTNKVRMALEQSPNLKVVRAKAVSRTNKIHRPGECHVNMRNQKLDYSKIHAKGNMRIKT
jgi:hypothetical protein